MIIIGHHTCSQEGTIEDIEQNGPFLSVHVDNDPKQHKFLGTGYYFWDNNIGGLQTGYADIVQTYQNISVMTKREKQDDTLRRLDEYFKNTPKEVVDKHIAKIDAMKFPGPTAEEYFLNFNQYYFGISEEESDESEEKDRA